VASHVIVVVAEVMSGEVRATPPAAHWPASETSLPDAVH
jgi:hypothetical protein